MHLNRIPHIEKVLAGITLLSVLIIASIFSMQVYGQEVFVTLTPADEAWYIVTNGRSAKIRECPSVDCKQIAVLRNRSTIFVIGVSEGWLEVQLRDGRKGYVAAFLTSPILPTPTASSTPNPSPIPPQPQANAAPALKPSATLPIPIVGSPPPTLPKTTK